MPKPRPPYIQGNYYHFYNRGSHKQSIFHDPRDYTYLLHHLKTYAQKFAIVIIAYCLLPNHYHILVRQDNHVEARVLIQRLFNRYGKTYREKYTHSGTLSLKAHTRSKSSPSSGICFIYVATSTPTPLNTASLVTSSIGLIQTIPNG